MSVRRPIVSLSDSHMHMKRKNSVSQLGVKPNINLNDKCTLWQGCTTKLDIRCTPSFGSIFHAKGKFSHKNSAPQLTIESVMASFATWHSQALKGLNVFSSQKVEHWSMKCKFLRSNSNYLDTNFNRMQGMTYMDN